MIPGGGRTVATPGVLHSWKTGQERQAAAEQAPAAPPAPDTWAGLTGDLPEHTSEVMASHTGTPTIAQQSASHGAPLPPVDDGISDKQKYA